MSNSHRKPGPVPGVWVDLKTQITPQLDRGLDQLVGLTGASKASLIRRAIADLLETAGLASGESVEFTLARGPGVGRQKKGQKR